MTYDNKSSAELEREVNDQRNRIESRIGEIKDRLSPGQLLDEALSYTRHGGAHFATNLGRQITANPMPAVLVGVGLAWLMSSNANGRAHLEAAAGNAYDDDAHPYARVPAGGLKRISHAADEAGQWWSEFETTAGKRYKARANEMGARAGHFMDDTGKMFSGFVDEAGNRIRDFQDEAGNAISQARGWADHGWRDLQRNLGNAVSGLTDSVRGAASGAATGTRDLGNAAQAQTDRLGRQIATMFDQQPLVAGALAFALGAAAGAALPHTEQEDELLGEQADKLRSKAGKEAAKLYEQGKEKAGDLYEETADKASQIYDGVKDQVGKNVDTDTASTSTFSRH